MERPVFNIEVVDPTSQQSRNYRGYSLRTPFWPRGQITSQKASEAADAGIMEPVEKPKKKLKLKLKPKPEPVPEAAPAPKKKPELKVSKAQAAALKAFAEMRKQKKEAKAEPVVEAAPAPAIDTDKKQVQISGAELAEYANARTTKRNPKFVKAFLEKYPFMREEEKPKGRVKQMAREIEKKIEKSDEIDYSQFKDSNELVRFVKDGVDDTEKVISLDQMGWINNTSVIAPLSYKISNNLLKLLNKVANDNDIKTPIELKSFKDQNAKQDYIFQILLGKFKGSFEDYKKTPMGKSAGLSRGLGVSANGSFNFISKKRLSLDEIKLNKEDMLKYIEKNSPKSFKDLNESLTDFERIKDTEQREARKMLRIKEIYRNVYNSNSKRLKDIDTDQTNFRKALKSIYETGNL